MPRVTQPAVIVFLAIFATAGAARSFPRQDIDYHALYGQGITFADFLEKARARREEWRAHYNDATVTPALITRMRALPAKRHLLIVAEDWCSDSLNREMGKDVMEAYKTPDGRAATPTIVVLGEDWHVIGTLTERPASVETWFLEKQKTTMQKPLHDELMAWYEKDAGKTTVNEIADLVER